MKKILPLFLLAVSFPVLATTTQSAFDNFKLGAYKAKCAIYHNFLATNTIVEDATNAALIASKTSLNTPNYDQLKANIENQNQLNQQKLAYHKAKADKFDKESVILMYQSLLHFDEKDLPEMNGVLGSNKILDGYSHDFKIGYLIASYKTSSKQDIEEVLRDSNKDNMSNSDYQQLMHSFKCDD